MLIRSSGKKGGIATGFHCVTPKVQALQFLYNDDLRGFTDFVNNEDVEARGEDRGHWINSPVVDDGSTLLEVSINKKREQFVETLLQVGARPDLVSPSSGLAPVS